VPLDRLTPAQESRLAELAAEWEAAGLATDPADRLRAERAIRAAYLAAELPAPSLCIWVRSPLEAVLGTAHLAGAGPEHLAAALRTTYLELIGRPDGELWSRVWAPFNPPEEDRLGEFLARLYGSDPRAVASLVDGWVWSDSQRRLRAQVSHGLAAQVRLEVGGPVRRSVVDRVWAPVCAQIQEEVWTRLKAHLDEWHAGRWPGLRAWFVVMDLRRLLRVQDALLAPARRRATLDRLAIADCLARVCGLEGTDRLSGLMELARSAGWWWPHRGGVVLCERPCRLERDAQGRLHAADGPAVQYPDGWAIWAWHGVRVSRQAIEQPEQLRAAEVLAEPDAEVRRVLIERLGTDRFLRDAGALRVAEDEAGILWRLDLPDDEPLVCVEVTNATPGPDAIFRRHVLRVPPDVRTPREAVAWTFGVSEDEYRPLRET
jgi:uncharacterized protein DUF6745